MLNLHIKNLGNIQSATLDMDKSLMVWCGPNYSGKTALSASQHFSVQYRALVLSPKTTKRLKVDSPKTRVVYHANGDLKWIGHNANYPIQ